MSGVGFGTIVLALGVTSSGNFEVTLVGCEPEMSRELCVRDTALGDEVTLDMVSSSAWSDFVLPLGVDEGFW